MSSNGEIFKIWMNSAKQIMQSLDEQTQMNSSEKR
jgi:hypothetical protein